MDTLDAIEKLAEIARAEQAPDADACGIVLALIRRERRLRIVRRSLALVSAIAASIVLMAGLWSWSPSEDALTASYELPEVSVPW